jgi:hypothetical protein
MILQNKHDMREVYGGCYRDNRAVDRRPSTVDRATGICE